MIDNEEKSLLLSNDINALPISTHISQSEKAKSLYSTLRWPLTFYSLLVGFYIILKTNWVWFSWHPLFMIVAVVLFAGNAALIKKMGGYENTKIHGYLMATAIAFASFAWYVIFSNKNMAGKDHLTTLHGKLGMFVLCGYFGVGLLGVVALHPDFGLFNTNKILRLLHKWSGRAFTGAAWFCCVIGNKVSFFLTQIL